MSPVSKCGMVLMACAGLVACNGGDSSGSNDVSGNCREYASLIDTGYEEHARTEFDKSTLTYTYTQNFQEYVIRTSLRYRALEDFILEGQRVSLGRFDSSVHETSDGDNTETREFDEDGRLSRSERNDSMYTDGMRTTVVEFDTWGPEGRPTRGYASETWDEMPEFNCDLAEMNYTYDDNERQIVIETRAGVPAGEFACNPGIKRLTYDEYGNLLLEERWREDADIATDEPSWKSEKIVRVIETAKVCL